MECLGEYFLNEREVCKSSPGGTTTDSGVSDWSIVVVKRVNASGLDKDMPMLSIPCLFLKTDL